VGQDFILLADFQSANRPKAGTGAHRSEFALPPRP
jgi:hypothetical protein